MSDEPIFHYNIPFDHDRSHSQSTSSLSTLSSVEEETQTFLDGAKEITAMFQDLSQTEKITFLRSRPDQLIPRKATPQSVGWNLFTLPNFNCVIHPGDSRLIPMGIRFGFPKGYYGQLQSRSQLAFQHGIYVQAGVIDPDYDGDIHVLLHNFGKRDYHVNANTAICQLILLRYQEQQMVEVDYSKQLRHRFVIGRVNRFDRFGFH